MYVLCTQCAERSSTHVAWTVTWDWLFKPIFSPSNQTSFNHNETPGCSEQPFKLWKSGFLNRASFRHYEESGCSKQLPLPLPVRTLSAKGLCKAFLTLFFALFLCEHANNTFQRLNAGMVRLPLKFSCESLTERCKVLSENVIFELCSRIRTWHNR